MNLNSPHPADSAALRLERHYAQKILTGAIAPGMCLPSTTEIARTWSVSNTTAQKAMQSLAALGLVSRSRKSGTVVRNHQERALIGIIVGPSLAEETASYYRALVTSLEALFQRHKLSCRVYDGTHPEMVPSAPDYHPLDIFRIDQIYNQFRGLVLIDTAAASLKEIFESDLPRVALDGDLELTDISYDYDGFAHAIFGAFAARNIGRALLVSSTERHKSAPSKAQLIFSKPENNQLGVALSHLVINFCESGPLTEERAFQAILKAGERWLSHREEMPQAIVVTDDIIARAVCMALLKLQIKVPEDLEIFVRTNESIDLHYGMPVHRYVHPVRELAKIIESLLWKRILNTPLPKLPITLSGKLHLIEGSF